MTKQKISPIVELTTPEFSSMMLYENEKERADYLEKALEEARKKVEELENLLKNSQMAHEATVRSYAKQSEKWDEMSSYVGKALSTRRGK